jgi:hypothetical protein
MSFPQLIEPNVKYCIFDNLQKCREHKSTIYAWIFNISGFLLLFSIIFIVLYFRRKEKLQPYEIEEKQRKEQQYVLSKIREYQMEKTKKPISSSAITNLPFTYDSTNFTDMK